MANYNEVFNRTLLEFMDDLIATFPELADFQALKKMTKAAIMIDPETVQAMFHKQVTLPYDAQILAKDETFFLNESYTNIEGADSSIVDKLKKVWKGLDDKNKEVIWNYMRVLVALDKKCVAQQQSA